MGRVCRADLSMRKEQEPKRIKGYIYMLRIYIPKGLPSFVLEMLGSHGHSIAQNVDIDKTQNYLGKEKGTENHKKPLNKTA